MVVPRSPSQPRAVTHVGLTVSDIDHAIAWYGKVLGYRLFFGPIDFAADDSHFGRLATDILGPAFKSGKLAHLASANQVGIELFQFVDPETIRPDDSMQYWKTGYFHICIIDPDPEALAQKIVDEGGRQRTAVWEIFPESGYLLVYCEDPFGNVIEVYSHSTEQVYSNR